MPKVPKGVMCMSNKSNNMILWMVTREYAGFAEAGGVKNVVKSLAEAAADYGFAVTVFLPHYGTKDSHIIDNLSAYTENNTIYSGDKVYPVRYAELVQKGIRFVFVDSEIFSEKMDIYTYCAEELDYFKKKFSRPDLKKGDGYVDSHEMNVIFQKAVCGYAIQHLSAPQVLHCHDAHTALLPAFITTHPEAKLLFRHTNMLITIHNAGDGYRQTFDSLDQAAVLTGLPRRVLELGQIDDTVEPFLVGQAFASLTTVSPWYAQQLKEPEQSHYSYQFSTALAQKNIHISGITNGIDFAAYDPRDTHCSGLPYAFDIQKEQFEGKYACRSFLLQKLQEHGDITAQYAGVQQYGTISCEEDSKTVYIMYHGRFVYQKGIDILLKAIPPLLKNCSALKFIFMGQGTTELENKASALSAVLPGKFVYCKGYNRKLARLITAAADFIILPSLFEPCGLEDLIAQVYGTIPIANAQGGLQKIRHGKTGFLYKLPKGSEQDIDTHIKILIQTVLEQAAFFLRSDKTRLTDIPYFKAIMLRAYQELCTTFSWKHIFADQYLTLYGSNAW